MNLKHVLVGDKMMADETAQPETPEQYTMRRAKTVLARQLEDAKLKATNPNAEHAHKHMRVDVYAKPAI
jgi:hypothetical protein